MLPVNKSNHCQAIINEQRFLIPKNFRRESIWLIKYMENSGYDKQDIYRLWQKLFCNLKEIDKDDPLVSATYEQLKIAARSARIEKPKNVIIYNEEIEAINAVFLPLWVKRFVLTLYCCKRLSGKKTIDVMDAQFFNEICALCGKKRVWVDEKHLLFASLIDSGLVVEKDVKYVDWDGQDVETKIYEFAFSKSKGKIAFTIYSPYDLGEFYDMIKNDFPCERCGKIFERSNKSKRCLCPECAKDAIKERISKNDKKRNKTATECECKSCGAIFIKTGNMKRDICEECWCEMRSKRRPNKKVPGVPIGKPSDLYYE